MNMFSGFFYALRDEGVSVSLNEWLALMEALSLDLADNSLTEFYYLARSLLVKSEVHFDKYDAAFVKCFGDDGDKGAGENGRLKDDKRSERAYNPDFFNPAVYANRAKQAAETAAESVMHKGVVDVIVAPQSGEPVDQAAPSNDSTATAGDSLAHSGGTLVAGTEELGSSGINFSGVSGGMTAVRIAGKRQYRDYQDERINNARQYEVALRTLRQLSTKYDGPRDELNIDATVEETGRNNGVLSLAWERPRKNTIKLLVLMDSIGSIYMYHDACRKLFNAAHKSTHFKELRFYYFHNCIYGRLYKDQWLDHGESIATEEFFRRHSADYRVLIVGDAKMGKQELTEVGGAIDWGAGYNTETGLTWLNRVARHFPHSAWLNPVPGYLWGTEPDYTTISMIGEVFPMFALTPDGIRKAVKKLMG